MAAVDQRQTSGECSGPAWSAPEPVEPRSRAPDARSPDAGRSTLCRPGDYLANLLTRRSESQQRLD